MTQDNWNLVDRFLNRVKNNRVTAVLIVIGVGLAALSSFTESLKKLSDALPTFSHAKVDGEW